MSGCQHIWSEWYHSPKDWDWIEFPPLSLSRALPFRKDCLCGCGSLVLRWGYDEHGSPYLKGTAVQ